MRVFLFSFLIAGGLMATTGCLGEWQGEDDKERKKEETTETGDTGDTEEEADTAAS